MGLLVSYMDGDLAAKSPKVSSPVSRRTALSRRTLFSTGTVTFRTIEAHVVWEIYRRTGRTELLTQNYDYIYRQLVFHMKHPGFYYLSPNHWFVSYLYCFYSLVALEKIAVAAGKDHHEIRKIRDLRSEMETACAYAWEKKESMHAAMYESVYQYAEGKQLAEILSLIKEHHLTSADQYFIYARPDGQITEKNPDDKMALDSLKMVHYLFFIPGLERLHEDDLLDENHCPNFCRLGKMRGFL